MKQDQGHISALYTLVSEVGKYLSLGEYANLVTKMVAIAKESKMPIKCQEQLAYLEEAFKRA